MDFCIRNSVVFCGGSIRYKTKKRERKGAICPSTSMKVRLGDELTTMLV